MRARTEGSPLTDAVAEDVEEPAPPLPGRAVAEPRGYPTSEEVWPGTGAREAAREAWPGGPRIALAHDYFNQRGGAERLFAAFAEEFPSAPIYTTVYRRELLPLAVDEQRMRSSFLQRIPAAGRFPRVWLAAYPAAVDDLDVGEFDVVLSSSSAWMKAIRPGGALHICYCHSVMKWAWQGDTYFSGRGGRAMRTALAPLLRYLRRWDRRSATPDRVHLLLANSRLVQERIRRYWGREAHVLNPGVDVGRFRPNGQRGAHSREGGYYLVLARLIPYKRVDTAVAACTRLGLALHVIGDGPDMPRLRKLGGSSVRFLGYRGDSEVAQQLEGCRALLFPGEEDFGIAPVEAMAAGRPVLALGRGGVRETVIPGETGEFYGEPTTEALVAALKEFDPERYPPSRCRARAEAFSVANFRSRLREHVAEAWEERRLLGVA